MSEQTVEDPREAKIKSIMCRNTWHHLSWVEAQQIVHQVIVDEVETCYPSLTEEQRQEILAADEGVQAETLSE